MCGKSGAAPRSRPPFTKISSILLWPTDWSTGRKQTKNFTAPPKTNKTDGSQCISIAAPSQSERRVESSHRISHKKTHLESSAFHPHLGFFFLTALTVNFENGHNSLTGAHTKQKKKRFRPSRDVSPSAASCASSEVYCEPPEKINPDAKYRRMMCRFCSLTPSEQPRASSHSSHHAERVRYSR